MFRGRFNRPHLRVLLVRLSDVRLSVVTRTKNKDLGLGLASSRRTAA